mgnify:CR=1 FL=1
MTKSPQDTDPLFAGSSPPSAEAEGKIPTMTASQGERGQGGANAAPSEVTVLERRVLAHERILQALICRLAEDDPNILFELKAHFGSGHDLGDYEQDFVSTGHYGEHFIRSVEREVTQRRDRSPSEY